MTAVLNLLIPILSAVAALAGIYFLIRSFSRRSAETRASYNVARQHAHRDRQVDLIRSIFSFIVALILLGVYGFSPRPLIPAPTATPTLEPTTAVPPTVSPEATQPASTLPTVPSEATRTPTSAPTNTATAVPPTPLPTDTPTPAPRTATVSSGVGVWLRAEPNTTSEQLEWLLDGTLLTVLSETATGENLAWQQVQTAEGLVGWVAVPFITYNE
ncbi:MAG TPA: SH3 domain-containing protein [Chloroflexota bacterium]|nr:SH3 domain-containing protein [Chloroflexota bacterium]